jgi:hypothetical protein
MVDRPESPAREAGWYSDPERAHTLRYWDGDAWTDDRAPDVGSSQASEPPEASVTPQSSAAGWTSGESGLTAQGKYAVGVGFAALGAVVAIVGVFLPLADTESTLHIAGNSLIQHWEGPVVIAIAIAGLMAAIYPATRPLTFLAGGALVLLAVLAGTSLPIEYRNEFSRAVAGNASPGAGVWTVGVGGALLAISALFADWGTWGAGDDSGTESRASRMSRFEEIMSGREGETDSSEGRPVSEQAEEPTADSGRSTDGDERPKGRRMRRFEEIMSGRAIPDPDAQSPDDSADPDRSSN